jgi:DNA-binding SARP family transcriptional activator/class 3 adenylate cyclase
MYYRVLGPLEIEDQGRPLRIGGIKRRALLAMLLMHANEVVPRDLLIQELWPVQPPDGAAHTLEVQVSRLRKLLQAGEGTQVIVTHSTGYKLIVGPEELDLLVFDRLVEEGRLAASSGENEQAAERFREALSLWRGRPFEDVAYESFAQIEIDRLEERRLAAIEERIDAELALGKHSQLASELDALVRQHPFRERLRGQLMLSLYRSGRQAEALTAYQDARRVLVEELGIDPGPTLRELEQAILRQDPALIRPGGGEGGERAAAQPRPRELLKTATVLFAELAPAEVGEHEPEALHEATLQAVHEVRAAVEYHGGSVERLTGEELLAVFGMPTAHEDDALRAGRTALQLRRALDKLGGAAGPERRIRIEPRTVIATGKVTLGYEPGSLDLKGAVITFARRLAETARSGEILVDDETVRRAENAFRTRTAEPRVLRGHQRPVSELRLLEAVDQPERGPSRRTPLVGRKPELTRLSAVLERAIGERRCVVAAVFGEAGIGKSRLAEEFAAQTSGTTAIFVGRCVSYGEGATYLPLREIVAQAAGEQAREQIAQLLAGDDEGELVARRVADLIEGAESETSSGEAFWAVRRFLERLARDRPVALILEDLHWAEPTLLDLVEYLGRWSSGSPILLLCLARPELVDERPAWASEPTSVVLEPLVESDTLELVASVGRDSLDPDGQALVAELAGGNPLFAEQLVAYAREEGPERLETVPPSLEALLSSRFDRLAPLERAVLQRAAVVGREFWHGAILHLSPPLEVPSVGRSLLELARKGFVEPAQSAFPREDAFRIHHVLIRDVAYNSIPRELRADLHELVGDWLELQGSVQDELIGYHLEQAYYCRVDVGTPDRRALRLAADAGERLADAGLRAARSGDTHAASGLLTRASSLLQPDEVTRRDLLTELGLVLWRGGQPDLAEQTLQNALEMALAEHDRRAELRARLELANFTLFRSPEGSAEMLLSSAAQAIPVLEQLGDDRALGRTWYVLAFVYGGLRCQYERSAEAAERAIEHFGRSTWPVAPCLQELAASLYYGPTPVPEAVARCKALLEGVDRGGEANILAFLAGLEALAGRFDTARELASRARGTYEELAWSVYVSTNYATVAADVELLAGNDAEAERILRQSCGMLEVWGERAHLATQAAQLGEAVYRQGRYDDAVRWADLAETCAATDDAGAQFSWRALRAKAVARQGEPAEAERLAKEAVALAGHTDALSQRGNVLLALGEVLRVCDRAAEAAAAIEDAIRLFEAKGNVAASAQARSLLGELATV